jgi:PAS domain-containing protein
MFSKKQLKHSLLLIPALGAIWCIFHYASIQLDIRDANRWSLQGHITTASKAEWQNFSKLSQAYLSDNNDQNLIENIRLGLISLDDEIWFEFRTLQTQLIKMLQYESSKQANGVLFWGVLAIILYFITKSSSLIEAIDQNASRRRVSRAKLKRYQKIVNNLPVGIARLNERGAITWANGTFRKTFPAIKVLRKKWSEVSRTQIRPITNCGSMRSVEINNSQHLIQTLTTTPKGGERVIMIYPSSVNRAIDDEVYARLNCIGAKETLIDMREEINELLLELKGSALATNETITPPQSSFFLTGNDEIFNKGIRTLLYAMLIYGKNRGVSRYNINIISPNEIEFITSGLKYDEQEISLPQKHKSRALPSFANTLGRTETLLRTFQGEISVKNITLDSGKEQGKISLTLQPEISANKAVTEKPIQRDGIIAQA